MKKVEAETAWVKGIKAFVFQVRDFAKENIKKRVIAYIAGLTAHKGRVRGHAGAIVSAYGESAVEKVELLKECGVTISKNPSVMGDTVKKVLGKS